MQRQIKLGVPVRIQDGSAGRLSQIVVDPDGWRPVLMTHSTILLQRPHRWVEVKRGMLVRSSEGLVAGQVAALVVDAGRQQVTHFLLTRLSSELDYRVVPVDVIQDVPVETLLLSISNTDVRHLPRWAGSGASISSGNNE